MTKRSTLACHQLLAQLRARQLLGRGEEELGPLVADLRVRFPRHVGGHRAVDLRRGHAERDQLVVLIAHQGDQRGHDDGHPRQEECRQLIAERLAGAGRHHRQRVPAGQHRIDHGALAGAELLQAEDRSQQLPHLAGVAARHRDALIGSRSTVRGSCTPRRLQGAVHPTPESAVRANSGVVADDSGVVAGIATAPGADCTDRGRSRWRSTCRRRRPSSSGRTRAGTDRRRRRWRPSGRRRRPS